jgi:hypothetical protein
MNILQYKELACADIDQPIVVILPDLAELQQEEKEFFHKLGQEDSLIHSGKIFGRKFKSTEELFKFAQGLDTIETAVAEIADPSRVLFDTEWEGDVASQLRHAMESKYYQPVRIDSPGTLLALQSVGRMSVSNELLIKSRRLSGTPLIDAPTSWQYLTWKMEYDAERAEHENNVKDLHMVRGLQDLSKNEMEWLGNIPTDALLEIRRQGAMHEIREILGKGVADLVNSNPSNFHRSREGIFDNVSEAFENHRKNISELRSKQWKFAGKDIGSWVVVGTLCVAAAATGAPVWALAAIAADQLLDAPKLKDIPQSIRELAEENNKAKKSPVGMLFSISKKNA